MERDPYEGGTDVGRDIVRDLSDEPPAAIRDTAPDILSPIDDTSPVSGHVPPPQSSGSAVDSPEHDWNLAKSLVRPAFLLGLRMWFPGRLRLGRQLRQLWELRQLRQRGLVRQLWKLR